MDVQILTKTFAEIVGYGPELMDRVEIEIESDQDAVAFCLNNKGLYFQTWKASYTVINGQEFHADPKDYSERNYVGLSFLYGKSAKIFQLGEEITEMSARLEELEGKDGYENEEIRARLKVECENAENERIRWDEDQTNPIFVNINENEKKKVDDLEILLNPEEQYLKPDYIRLNPGDVVYNPQGRKIWPAPQIA